MLRLKAALAICFVTLFCAACSSSVVTTTRPGAAAVAPTPTPRPAQPALEKQTYTVQQGVVADELKLSGRVAATLDQDMFFTQDGFLKTVYVKRTDVVTKGQLLAELDLGTLPNELSQAQVAFDSAQLVINRSEEQRAFAVKKAQIDLEDAQAKVAELKQPPKPDKIDAARLAVESARIALEDARNSASAAKTQAQLAVDLAANAVRDRQAEFARIVELNGTQTREHLTPEQINAQEKAERAVQDAQTDLQKARVAYDEAHQSEVTTVASGEAKIKDAQVALDALLAGPDKLELADAQRGVRRAQVALEEAGTSSADPELENKAKQAQLDLDTIKTQVESRRIYSPFDGQVADITARPGDSVPAYKAVVNVINPAKLELVVDSTLNSDLQKIGIGQQARTTFSRYPTKVFTATVERLPSTLTSTGSSVQADPAVHFSFDSTGLDLDVGDIASMVLTLERKDAALWLPPQAVRSFEGRRFVVVQDGQRQRRADVKVGIISTDRIEILDGLKAGDVVIGQ